MRQKEGLAEQAGHAFCVTVLQKGIWLKHFQRRDPRETDPQADWKCDWGTAYCASHVSRGQLLCHCHYLVQSKVDWSSF
jgi:hypothetical protein